MESTTSTNAEITLEDFEKSLLISDKTAYMDPRKDYREWLKLTLRDLFDKALNGDEKAASFVKMSINNLILYSTEERIKINFDPWIWPYIDLLEEAKKNRNIDCSPCSVED